MFSKELFFLVQRSLKTNPSTFFTCVLAMLHALALLFNLRKFLNCGKICIVPSKIPKSAFSKSENSLRFPLVLTGLQVPFSAVHGSTAKVSS